MSWKKNDVTDIKFVVFSAKIVGTILDAVECI